MWEWACSPEWSGWLRVFYPQVLEMWNQVLTGMVWLWRKSKFPCCCSHLSFIGSTMKSWSLSSQLRVSVRDCRLLKVVYYYFFIHLWVIPSSRTRHMNGCAWKLCSVLCLPLWAMFTIYLWKHSNNKTLYIAFQFAVRADKIFLSWAELHTLGDAVGPTWNNKTLQREAGTVEPASEAWALHWPQCHSFLCATSIHKGSHNHYNVEDIKPKGREFDFFVCLCMSGVCTSVCRYVCPCRDGGQRKTSDALAHESLHCALETGSLTTARLAANTLKPWGHCTGVTHVHGHAWELRVELRSSCLWSKRVTC